MSNTADALRHGAVQSLLAAVKYAKDDEDEGRFVACWTEDARLEITSNGDLKSPIAGREAILAFYRQVWAAGGHGKGATRETHVAEHPDVVLVDDHRMVARHAVSFFNAVDGEPRLVGFGTFRDEIVLNGDAWRIALRQSVLTRRR